MRRTFIATPIEPGAKLSQTHTKLRNALKNEKIKWVDGDHFHITLFFLGDTSERAITQVRQKLGDLLPGFSAFLSIGADRRRCRNANIGLLRHLFPT